MTNFSSLAPNVRALWAKSDQDQGHGLLAHMLDVASVAEAILLAEPPASITWAARSFGLQPDQAVAWIAALVGLHDFGKSIPDFQSKWPEGKQRVEAAGLAFPRSSRRDRPHAEATAVLLQPLLERQGLEGRWIEHALQAISAHHGYNLQVSGLASEPADRKWNEARSTLFDAYWTMLAPQGQPVVDELSTPAVEWLAGLTSVADWIGSNVEWFSLGERHDALADYLSDARTCATAALKAIGWTNYSALLDKPADSDRLIKQIVQRPDVNSARPLQQAGDQLLAGIQGPALLLVEAPMGEGKTELAFLAHLRLQAANGHRGLYLALPTQATGNALFERALTFLRAFADDRQLDMQLVHGGAAMNDTVAQLRGVFGEDGSRTESVSSAAWFSQRRRPLLSPYGVGTIDQALLAVLNVKHHFVRTWGLGNRVVVLDEVHAYDTYTSGLIEMLLQWLKALGSSVVLMSATLPRARRDALLQAWGTTQSRIPELPYPRILLTDQRGVTGATFDARQLPPIQLESADEELEALADCALDKLDQGGCGAVIVNTVKRAQQLYRLLKERADSTTELLLFHARFPADQRSAIEQAVLTSFGQSGTRPQRALLIATQVAEQSLDIDFDFMLTDLAPIDLILQRAGRLHRHQRQRPAAHASARLCVAGLRPDRLPELKQTDWEFVYQPYILGRSWALLSRESVLSLPQDIDRLVQAVYGDESLPDDLDEQARGLIEGDWYGKYLAERKNQNRQSANIGIDPADEPQTAYLSKPRGRSEEEDGLGLINRTRLGDDSIGLVPVHVGGDGWRLDADGEAFDPQALLPDALARKLCARQLNISRRHVVAHFGSIQSPRSFAEHPLLRHLKPLPLDEGTYTHPELKQTLRLDAELGLLIE